VSPFAANKVTSNGFVTTYSYDALGRRVLKSVTNQRFLYDGDNVLSVLDDAGEVRLRYSYYPGVNRPHSVQSRAINSPYYVASELPWSVTGLVDRNGTLLANWDYDPWGVPTTLTGADSIPFTERYAARIAFWKKPMVIESIDSLFLIRTNGTAIGCHK